MWIRIRAVIIENELLAAQYLAELLDDTCQIEVVGSATESEAGMRLCAELRPDAVFVDINLPGKGGVSPATQLAMLPQPPRLRVGDSGGSRRFLDLSMRAEIRIPAPEGVLPLFVEHPSSYLQE